MHLRLFSMIVPMIALQGVIAMAEQPDVSERALTNRLNNLESQSIQRQGREPAVSDLLRRQDNRLAGQSLNTLKTRTPRNTSIPILERKLDRSRRPVGSFGRR